MNSKARPCECCETPLIPMPLLPERQNKIVAAFKALSDPSRFEIFRFIAAQEAPICACDVVDRFDLTQPTISHHLKVLREAGLIQATRRGIWAHYEVDVEGLSQLQITFRELAPVGEVLR